MNHLLGFLNDGVGFSDGRMQLGKEQITVWAELAKHRDNRTIRGSGRGRRVTYEGPESSLRDGADAYAHVEHRWHRCRSAADGSSLERPS